jgi:hypothetical protein
MRLHHSYYYLMPIRMQGMMKPEAGKTFIPWGRSG